MLLTFWGSCPAPSFPEPEEGSYCVFKMGIASRAPADAEKPGWQCVRRCSLGLPLWAHPQPLPPQLDHSQQECGNCLGQKPLDKLSPVEKASGVRSGSGVLELGTS